MENLHLVLLGATVIPAHIGVQSHTENNYYIQNYIFHCRMGNIWRSNHCSDSRTLNTMGSLQVLYHLLHFCRKFVNNHASNHWNTHYILLLCHWLYYSLNTSSIISLHEVLVLPASCSVRSILGKGFETCNYIDGSGSESYYWLPMTQNCVSLCHHLFPIA